MNKEQKLEYNRRYRAEHKSALSEAARAYRQRHDPKVWSQNNRRSHLKVWYGLSPEGYQFILSRQGHACAICECQDWAKKHPHIDHDHRTGRVRGVLCQRCNSALGFLGDNPRATARALVYLLSHENQDPLFGNRHTPLTLDDLSAVLQFRPATIRQWIKKYRLPCYKKDGNMLFMPADVDLWVRGFARNPQTVRAAMVEKILALAGLGK